MLKSFGKDNFPHPLYQRTVVMYATDSAVLERPITEEEILAEFRPYRLAAIDHPNYTFTLFHTGMSEERRKRLQVLSRIWEKRGWIKKSLYSEQMKICYDSRAYAPDEERRMEPMERQIYISAANLSRKCGVSGTVLVTEFERLLSKEGLNRLIVAGDVFNTSTTNPRYVLLKELWDD